MESYTTSINLSLAAREFAHTFEQEVTRPALIAEIHKLDVLAGDRLTAAMVGLLRSFAVNAFEADSAQGWTMLRTVNQVSLPERMVVEEVDAALREVKAALRGLTLGGGVTEDLDLSDRGRLFECGWSWGVVADAPVIDVAPEVFPSEGVAYPAPYLYFSAVALDAIAEAFTERVRLLGLLDDVQQRLATALQVRWDITQRYWSTVASFGSGRWPLEDIPWRTTDGQESEYFSLLVTAITVQDLISQRAPDTDLRRVGAVLGELANRARITRRPVFGDRAISLHAPGTTIVLEGSGAADASPLVWLCTDFSPLLMKRTLWIARLMRDTELRGEMLTQADAVWDHLIARRVTTGPARDLWDDVRGVFVEANQTVDVPSWSYTERVVECIVAAAQVITDVTFKSERLATYARELISEAEQLFDRELLNGSTEGMHRIRDLLTTAHLNLRRARLLVDERPGTAATLATEVLLSFGFVGGARLNVSGNA